MPMNQYGEIVRNTPPPRQNRPNRNNRNNRNNGRGGNGFTTFLIVALILAFLYSSISGTGGSGGSSSTSSSSNQSAHNSSESTGNGNYEDYIQTGTDYGIYKDGHGISSSDYVIGDSNSRKLTENDVNKLTLRGINYAKNEIYARHGRKFKSRELQNFFNSRDWYDGYLEASTDSDRKIRENFNSYEKYNVDLLNDLESSMGMYELDK